MMKKIKTKIIVLCTTVVLLIVVAGCAQNNLDVVGSGSVQSFSAILDAAANNVSVDKENIGWSLTAPDKSARFIWGDDWSKSPVYDAMIEFNVAPFVAAGLDVNKLPGYYISRDNKLLVGIDFGSESPKNTNNTTALNAYKQIVDLRRNNVNYHTQLDHYGIVLGNGNMFEWAKDMKVNSKDIVFVLNPEPLIAAGVDPKAVDGWAYALVPVDIDGKPVEVYKFLKPFDLK